MVTLTSEATAKLTEALKAHPSEAGLRVGVQGGGCSGFTYRLFLDLPREHDLTFEEGGIAIYIEPDAQRYVEGCEIDWVKQDLQEGFEVRNPNAVATCGCGSSFRIAGEEPSCGAVLD